MIHTIISTEYESEKENSNQKRKKGGTNQTRSKHSSHRQELGLELINHDLHAAVEDVQIRLIGHLQQIYSHTAKPKE